MLLFLLLPFLALRAWADAAVSLNNYDAGQPICYLAAGTLTLPPGVQVQIWGGPMNAPLLPLSDTTGRNRFDLSEPGYFDAGVGVIAGVPDNGPAQFQIRAWKDAADFDSATCRGASEIFVQTTGANPPLPELPTPAPLHIPAPIVLTNQAVAATAPIIQIQPMDLSCPAGSTAAFTVATYGSPPLSFAWSFNGSVIPLATNGTLLLNNVQATQTGAYIVTVSNPYGEATSASAILTVLSAPLITSPPQDTTIVAGTTAALQVSALGSDPLTYQWFFNGAALPGATRASLVIENIQPGQAGNYTVTVANSLARVSQSARLTVLLSLAAISEGLGAIQRSPDLPGYATNSSVTLTAIPSAVSTFAGWSGDIVGTSNPVTLTMDQSKIVTAHFASSWALTTPPPVGGTITRQPDLSLYPSGALITLTAIPASNYVFASWGGDALSTNTPLSVRLNTNQLITATFKRLFTITSSLTGQGVVILSPPQPHYVEGATVIVTARSSAGYRFTGWGGDLSGTNNPAPFKIDSDKNIVANFAAARTLTTLASPGGAIQRIPDLSGYLDGDHVQLTALPDPGFAFAGWAGDASGSNNLLSLTIHGDCSVIAQFVDRQAPVITLFTPTSGSTTNPIVSLTGSATDNAGIAILRWERNGLPQGDLPLADGRFSLSSVRLLRGDNRIRFVAQDPAGNQSTTEVLVTYVVGSGLAAGPFLTGMTPASGAPGSLVTLYGGNFEPSPGNNTVFFGAAKAQPITVTQNTLTVTVPLGATFAPVTLSTLAGLTASTPFPFQPTFAPAGEPDAFSFSSRTDFSLSAAPRSLAVGDLNLDGRPDLAVACYDAGLISIAQNTCTPRFIGAGSLSALVNFPTGANPSSLAIADLDGDGLLELVVANESSDSLSVYQHTGSTGRLDSAWFSQRVDFSTGSHPYSVAVADIDGDGKLDLLVVNQAGASLSLLRNRSSPGPLTTNSFDPHVDFPLGGFPTSLAVSDFDGDGQSDIAVAVAGKPVISLFRNLSQPGQLDTNSLAARLDLPVSGEPRGLLIADVDGDGQLDLLVADGAGSSISVLRNTSNAGGLDTCSFSDPVAFATGRLPRSIAIGDLNGDARPDLAVANYGDGNISVLVNRSVPGHLDAASFAPHLDYLAGSHPRGIAIVDVDGDAKPDLLVINSSPAISILRNTVETVQPVFLTSALPQPTANGLTLTLLGKRGIRYQLQASDDLQNWLSVFTGTNLTGRIEWSDPAAAFHPRRFYRALAE